MVASFLRYMISGGTWSLVAPYSMDMIIGSFLFQGHDQ